MTTFDGYNIQQLKTMSERYISHCETLRIAKQAYDAGSYSTSFELLESLYHPKLHRNYPLPISKSCVRASSNRLLSLPLARMKHYGRKPRSYTSQCGNAVNKLMGKNLKYIQKMKQNGFKSIALFED